MNIFCARASSRHYQISHTTQKSSKLTKTCFLHPELCSLLFTWCENNDENKFAKIIRKKNQLNFRDKIKMISKMKQKNLILGIKYEKKLEIWRQNRKKWIWILAPKMKKKLYFGAKNKKSKNQWLATLVSKIRKNGQSSFEIWFEIPPFHLNWEIVNTSSVNKIHFRIYDNSIDCSRLCLYCSTGHV